MRQDVDRPAALQADTGGAHRLAQVEKIVHFFRELSPASLDRLDEIYARDAGFADPFNEVTGVVAIRRIFADMYQHLEAPRFEILDSVSEGERCVLLWNFHFRRKGRAQVYCVHGNSVLALGEDGKILGHRDYWDPARELYEGIPLLGTLLRMIRHKLSASL